MFIYLNGRLRYVPMTMIIITKYATRHRYRRIAANNEITMRCKRVYREMNVSIFRLVFVVPLPAAAAAAAVSVIRDRKT